MAEETKNESPILNLKGPLEFVKLRAICEALPIASKKCGSRSVKDCIKYIAQNATKDKDLAALGHELPTRESDMLALLRMTKDICGRDATSSALVIPTPSEIDYQKGRYDRYLQDTGAKLEEGRVNAEQSFNTAKKQRRKDRWGRFFAGLGWVGTLALSVAGIGLGAGLISGAFSALAAGASLTSGAFLATAGIAVFAGKFVIKGLGGLFKICANKFSKHNKSLKENKKNFKELKANYKRANENCRENVVALESSNTYYPVKDLAAYNRGLGYDEFVVDNDENVVTRTSTEPEMVVAKPEEHVEEKPVEERVEERTDVAENARSPYWAGYDDFKKKYMEANGTDKGAKKAYDEARKVNKEDPWAGYTVKPEEVVETKPEEVVEVKPEDKPLELTEEQEELILKKLENGEDLTEEEESYFAANDKYKEIQDRINSNRLPDFTVRESFEAYDELEKDKQTIQAEIDEEGKKRTAWVEKAVELGKAKKGADKIRYAKNQEEHDAGLPWHNEVVESSKKLEEAERRLRETKEYAVHGDHVGTKEELQKAVEERDAYIKAEIERLRAARAEKKDDAETKKDNNGKKGAKKTDVVEDTFVAESSYNSEKTYAKLMKEVEEYNNAVKDLNEGKISYEEFKARPVGKTTVEKVSSEWGKGSLAYRIATHNKKNQDKAFEISTRKIEKSPEGLTALREKVKEAKEEVDKKIVKADAGRKRGKAGENIGVRLGTSTIGNVTNTKANFAAADPELAPYFKGKSFAEIQKMIDMLLNPKDNNQRKRAEEIFGAKAKDKTFKDKVKQTWNQFKVENNIVFVKGQKNEDIALEFNTQFVKNSSASELKKEIKAAAQITDTDMSQSRIKDAMTKIEKAADVALISADTTPVEVKKDGNYDYSTLKDKDYAAFLEKNGLPRGRDSQNKYREYKNSQVADKPVAKKSTNDKFDYSTLKDRDYAAFLERNNLPRSRDSQEAYRKYKNSQVAEKPTTKVDKKPSKSAYDYSTLRDREYAAFLEKNGLPRSRESQEKYKESKKLQTTESVVETKTSTNNKFDYSTLKDREYAAFLEKNGLPKGRDSQEAYRKYKNSQTVEKQTPAAAVASVVDEVEKEEKKTEKKTVKAKNKTSKKKDKKEEVKETAPVEVEKKEETTPVETEEKVETKETTPVEVEKTEDETIVEEKPVQDEFGDSVASGSGVTEEVVEETTEVETRKPVVNMEELPDLTAENPTIVFGPDGKMVASDEEKLAFGKWAAEHGVPKGDRKALEEAVKAYNAERARVRTSSQTKTDEDEFGNE